MASPCNHRRRIRRAVFLAAFIRRIRRLSRVELEAILTAFDAMPDRNAPGHQKARLA